MDEPTERVRRAIRQRLASLTDGVKARLAAIVADPPEPEWGILQFEIDPFSWGIHFVEDGDPVFFAELIDWWFSGDEVCAEAGVDAESVEYDEAREAEALDWLADCWDEVGGNNVPYRVEAFFHGYHLDRFDLRNRCWNHLV